MGKYATSVDDHLVVPARVNITQRRARDLRSLGHFVPQPITVRLIIDTGSKRSTLIPIVMDRLQPNPGGASRVITSLGSVTTRLFWIRMEFPEAGLAPFPEVLVARLPMPPVLRQFH